MDKPFERAINPNQYDLDNLDWLKEGRFETTRTQFFWEYLKSYSESWKDKTVLDIGAGSGWLVDQALKAGANQAVGIDPSEVNIIEGKKEYPNTELIQTTLENYDNKDQKFDKIISVMAFPHIADIDSAFRKINSLLSKEGEAIIIVPDYDYFQTPYYERNIQNINEEEYAVEVQRPIGKLADIVRKTSVYKKAGEQAGLECIEEKEMKPTENQISKAPKYAKMKDKALTHLLVFKHK